MMIYMSVQYDLSALSLQSVALKRLGITVKKDPTAPKTNQEQKPFNPNIIFITIISKILTRGF